MKTAQQGNILAGLLVMLGIPAALIAGAAYFGGDRVRDYLNENKGVAVPLSEGRIQLLNEGISGNRKELENFLTEKANDYFKVKGFNCDPGSAAKTVGATVAKAKCEPRP